MRSLRVLLILIPGCFAAPAPHAADAPKTIEYRTEVLFVQPERFSDVKEAGMSTPQARERILAQVRSHLRLRAQDRVPPGQRLVIVITDLDLAGDFELRRPDPAGQVRIVKSIYPPRIDLGFKLIGTDGRVVKEGRRELRDLAFMAGIGADTTEPLYYEKRLLDAWLREEFPAPKR